MVRIHQKLYKKDLNDPDNHDDMITHLEPDIMECEVKRALRKCHYKANGGDGFLPILFQILKDEAVNAVLSMNGHETGQALGDGEFQGSLAYCSPWSCKWT